MKRFWLGVVLIAVLLAAGIRIGSFMNRTGKEISGILESAAQAAQQGDLQTASDLASEARDQWDRVWRCIAAMADHNPMDEIDSLFSQLMVYADTGNADDFAAYCSRISQLILAIGEAHSFSWWNLL